ncbi:hypothetical protein [Ancylobacter defluvii]|uniref:Uncharacterized protein n=1 Tax=Ancylobacter defluvii TaxID=1282440 RepID=A0A9W6NB63_9HYPH|nr:hypothetical protein [Ancylobacter defluvii]MBS7589620.1 hypothetical protein [Ancylobacter defluvii]GLK85239.1 hypothetical protein GCM10017653_33090 [Ancylobacter defluvii]
MVALTRLNMINIENKPIAELLSGRRREGEALDFQLRLMTETLAKVIDQRGDKKIGNPRRVSEDFIASVREISQSNKTKSSEFVLKMLFSQGVTLDNIKNNSTVGELLQLGLFRSQLKIGAKAARIPYERAVEIAKPEQLPSWQISRALEKYTPDTFERKGSEITDTYLACISPYADVTLVDKRTREAFRQYFNKNPHATRFINRVEFAAGYREIPRRLAGSRA